MNSHKKLVIGYFADGIWAHRAFNKIIADNDLSIVFVCARYNQNDKILESLAEKHSIEFLKHPNINSSEFISRVKKYNCDLFVSMSFDQIFKKEIINLPRLKTINCHAGKLPFYRGRNILNWALINDEREFGITAHYIDEGIDTGDIIVQKTYLITDTDNYKTLLKKAHRECANVLYEAIINIKNGNVKRIKQETIHPLGFYCGMRKEGDELINWTETSREIFNFIRAICEPGPKAKSFINGREIKINKANLINGASLYKNIPGQVIGKAKGRLIIKTGDSSLEVEEYEYPGVIKIGDKLKNA